MDTIAARDWIELSLSRADQAFVAWVALIAVSLALIGLLAKAGSGRRGMRWPTIVGYLVFSVSNAAVLWDLTLQQKEFVGALTVDFAEHVPHLAPPSLALLASLHVAIDIVVVLILGKLSRQRIAESGPVEPLD